MITRFAPSPTGLLHLGNARTALIAYLYAKSCQGKFLLRIDDTDTLRSNQYYIDQIIEDLKWLNIKFDDIFFQSKRFVRYKEILDHLIAEGRVYPCFESKKELELKRKALLKLGLPPVYDRASLGKKPNLGDKGIYYRFKINYDEIVSWQDKLRGDISIDLKSTSDPIILRENGIYTYMLPSVIDDMDYKITSILRGEDHITNTAIQIQMLKAIGAKNIPEFIHIPIVRVKDEKMSKRSGGWDLQSFRSNGIEPEAIANYLVNLGNNLPVDMCDNILQSDFDIKNYSSSSAMIDEKDILRTNKKFLQNCNFADIKDKINLDIDENFWNFVKCNIEKLSEIKIWKAICSTSFSKPKAQDINTQLIKDALSLLPKKNISDNTYKTWVNALVKNQKYSKKEINMSIRMSLTNMRHGPELGSLLPIIGLQEVIRRLREQIE